MVSFATRTASASSANGITAAIGSRLLDEDPRPRTAVLSGVAEDGQRRCRGGGLEIGVGEDHVRRLAAELERDALDGLRGERTNAPTDLGRSGEGDLRDVGM